MNKFTKSMAAIAVSALIAGPAAALEFDAFYEGEKASVKLSGDGCDKDETKNLDIAMEFVNGFNFDFAEGLFNTGPYTGFWDSALFSFGEEVDGEGTFIISKPGKTSLDAPKEAAMDVSEDVWTALEAILGDYGFDNCKKFDIFLAEVTTIKKFNTKWSKDGDVAEVKLEVESKYETTDDKEKKVKLALKSGKMDLIGVD